MLEVAARRLLGDLPLDVAFTGPADGVTVLFGSSGAGKSATLAIVAGVLAADAARVALDGHVLTDTSARVFVPPERRRIGVVHQDARLFPHLSVERNLRYGWRRARGERRIAVGEVVEVLAIGPLLGRRPGALSGGERQRVALGRALLSQPSLLLLDEPVSALDHARRDEVLGFVEALKRRFRLPMVYVTHSPDEARRLGDHLVRIDAGRVVAQGRPTDLLAGDAVTGTVIGRDADALLVQVGAGTLRVPGLDRPVGATVRIG